MSLFSNNIFSPKGDTGKMEDERDSVTPTPSLVEAPTESTSSPDNHKDPPIIMNTPSPHATGITRGFTDFGTPPMRPAEHNSDDGVPFASVGKKVVLNLRPTTGYTDATRDERRAHRLTDEELNARRSGANDPWTPDSEASPDEKTAPHEALMNRATKFSSKKAEKNKQKAESTHYNTRGPGGYSPVLDSLNRVWNKGQEHGFVPIAEYKQRLKKASPFSEECKTKGWDFKVTNEFGEEVLMGYVKSRSGKESQAKQFLHEGQFSQAGMDDLFARFFLDTDSTCKRGREPCFSTTINKKYHLKKSTTLVEMFGVDLPEGLTLTEMGQELLKKKRKHQGLRA